MEIDTEYTDFITCPYCGYDDESPTPELIKEACDHETICEKNPYTAQIRNLKRERDEAREEAKNLRRMSVVELMGENLNVNHHVTAWENRCLKAERERDEARKFSNDLTDKHLEATGHLQRERNELLKAMREILKVSEPTPVLTYQKMEDIASKALKEQNIHQLKN